MIFFHSVRSFFREEAVAGLNIGEDYITATSLFLTEDKKLQIKDIGYVENGRGLSDQETAKLIQRLWRDSNIQTKTVSFSIKSRLFALRYFNYPKLSDSELNSALNIEAEQMFQKPKEELCMDWFFSNNSKDKIGGIIAVTPLKVTEKYLNILKMACLYPVAMEVPSFSISNLFLSLNPSYIDNTVCIINLDRFDADFAIIEGDKFIYPRNIYSKDVSWHASSDYFVENVNDIIRYYEFKLHMKKVEKIILTGEFLINKELEHEIRNRFDIPIETWDPLKQLGLGAGLSFKDKEGFRPIFNASLGLAIREIKNVF
ncbi:MAG: pilus assembly protein PilM [Candidatus Omnitrophota bacterium]